MTLQTVALKSTGRRAEVLVLDLQVADGDRLFAKVAADRAATIVHGQLVRKRLIAACMSNTGGES